MTVTNFAEFKSDVYVIYHEHCRHSYK